MEAFIRLHAERIGGPIWLSVADISWFGDYASLPEETRDGPCWIALKSRDGFYVQETPYEVESMIRQHQDAAAFAEVVREL